MTGDIREVGVMALRQRSMRRNAAANCSLNRTGKWQGQQHSDFESHFRQQ
jgi:hypothetical protein